MSGIPPLLLVLEVELEVELELELELELLDEAIPPIPPLPLPPIPPLPPVSPLLLDELEVPVVVLGFSSTSPHARNAVLASNAPSQTNACFFIVV